MMSFAWRFIEAVFRVPFPQAAVHMFKDCASHNPVLVHIWWNNTVMHPSDIFISGKAQPCYEIQLNGHFCHIN